MYITKEKSSNHLIRFTITPKTQSKEPNINMRVALHATKGNWKREQKSTQLATSQMLKFSYHWWGGILGSLMSKENNKRKKEKTKKLHLLVTRVVYEILIILAISTDVFLFALFGCVVPTCCSMTCIVTYTI